MDFETCFAAINSINLLMITTCQISFSAGDSGPSSVTSALDVFHFAPCIFVHRSLNTKDSKQRQSVALPYIICSSVASQPSYTTAFILVTECGQ